jgi:hypothetical protein
MPSVRPKFVLIEQSLFEVGGHYFEYAADVLQAAEAAGYLPILAANTQFAAAERLPERWYVRSIFPYVSDRIHRIPSAYSFGLWRQMAAGRGGWAALLSRLTDAVADRCKATISRWRWWRRRTRVSAFAASCEALFREFPLSEGDQVLCSTMADMDLLGLVRFLSRHPESAKAAWHLQSHFSVFSGRDPDYPAQDSSVEPLRRRMAGALATIPNHRLHFYTTTDELGRQFNRLNVAPFQTLHWPVGRQFQATPAPRQAEHARPLRVLCAGGVRREKGSDQLGSLVQSLWQPLLESGRIQLLFQLGARRRALTMVELPRGSFATANDVDALPEAPLVSLPHPLRPEQYARLIKGANIGLLIYNSDVYFARCSGILAELLAAGVPVIVPAGCWLAEQIAEENFRYLDGLADRRLTTAALQSLQTTIARPPESSDLVVRLWRSPQDPPGSYVRIECQQLDRDGQSLSRFATIVGRREGGDASDRAVSGLFHLDAACENVRFTIASAYHDASPRLEDACVDFLSPPADAAHWPSGSIGLTMSAIADVPLLLNDLVEHYERYRHSALAFSRRWSAQHAAENTILQLAARAALRLPNEARAA